MILFAIIWLIIGTIVMAYSSLSKVYRNECKYQGFTLVIICLFMAYFWPLELLNLFITFMTKEDKYLQK